MISIQLFCHRKSDVDNVIFLLTQKNGFIQVSNAMQDILGDEREDYEGTLQINGKNAFSRESDSLYRQEIEDVVLISNQKPAETPFPGGRISARLDSYRAKHEISITDTIFIQNFCLAIGALKNKNDGYVYVNLLNSEKAPLALSALKEVFEGEDLLFSLPNNLKFEVSSLTEKTAEKKVFKNVATLTLEEGYEAFFNDICDISKPSFGNLKKPALECASPKKVEKEEPKPKNEKKNFAATPFSKLDSKVKKDTLGDLFFALLFVALSIAAPYFYFCLLSQAATIYFTLYVILDVFFLLMSSLAASYFFVLREKLSKGYFYFGISIPLILETAGAFVFYAVASKNAWVGKEAYIFFGISLGYLLICPLFIYVYQKISDQKKKAKPSK